MPVSSYSTTAASNTSVGGTNIGEGCPPGNVNDGLRAIMADIASWYASFSVPTITTTGNASIGGDVTAAGAGKVYGTFRTTRSGNESAHIELDASGLTSNYALKVAITDSGTIFNNATPVRSFNWQINSATKMTLQTSGELCVGTTSLTAFAGVKGVNVGGATSVGYAMEPTTGASWLMYNTSGALRWFTGIEDRMELDTSGNLTLDGNIVAGGTITGSSDETLKVNIRPIENASAIADEIEGALFDWLASGEEDAGVIAQRVLKVFPVAVRTNPKTGKLTVNPLALIGLLFSARKEDRGHDAA